uniref:Enhancer of polycomb homolog n=1 Tax=Neogobius melanostomus TaxID=47308 RepID=A0A8C6SG61_9GOBI
HVFPLPRAFSLVLFLNEGSHWCLPPCLERSAWFSLDTEQPDYDLDADDEAFVLKLKKKMEISLLQFEEMIDRLEKGSGQQLVSLPEAKLLLKEDDELIKEVFEYWSRKRRSSKAQSLIPTVKQEKRDGSSTNDPYVAFQNRKNDEASYEKMLKLRRDLSRAVTILEMIKRREKSKRELLHLTLEICEKRCVCLSAGTSLGLTVTCLLTSAVLLQEHHGRLRRRSDGRGPGRARPDPAPDHPPGSPHQPVQTPGPRRPQGLQV